MLKDHLGSTGILADSTGNVVADQRYYPFGETRLLTGTMYTNRLFTGQREMTGTGIYYYGARYYSPKLGRFLSADALVPGYGNPQNLNRYGYVRNNPLRYTDPTGHKPCGDGEDTDCDTGHKQDPHPPKPPKPKKDDVVVLNINYCDTHPGACPNPATPSVTLPIPTVTTVESGDNASPVVSVVGVLLLVQLGILDTLLSIEVASVALATVTVPGAQIGLVGELVLVPLDFVSFNLTIYAVQMVATGSANHDPLPILHAVAPNVLPYKP